MEGIPASSAPLVGCLHVGSNNTIANRTFTLPFQNTFDVPSKRNQSFDDTAGAEDNDLKGAEPRLPIFLRNSDSSA